MEKWNIANKHLKSLIWLIAFVWMLCESRCNGQEKQDAAKLTILIVSNCWFQIFTTCRASWNKRKRKKTLKKMEITIKLTTIQINDRAKTNWNMYEIKFVNTSDKWIKQINNIRQNARSGSTSLFSIFFYLILSFTSSLSLSSSCS